MSRSVSAVISAAPAPVASYELLDHARRCLSHAEIADTPAQRYSASHLAALRAAAAVLAARTAPQLHSRRPRSAWVLLTKVAPELSEWATYFAAGALKRAAAEAGIADAVNAREADDLMRDAESFVGVCTALLDATD